MDHPKIRRPRTGAQRKVELTLTDRPQTQEQIETALSIAGHKLDSRQVNRALSALASLGVAERNGSIRGHHTYRRGMGFRKPDPLHGEHGNIRCMFDAFTREVMISHGNSTILLSLDDAHALGERIASLPK